MGRQFLENIWPVLIIARFLGMFPCQRIWNDDGTTELKPINWKVQWSLYSFYYLVLIGSGCLVFGVTLFKSEETSADIMACMKRTNGDDVVDMISSAIMMLSMSVGLVFVHYVTFKMKHSLCDLSRQFKNTSSKISTSKPFWIVFGLQILTFLLSSCLQGIMIEECSELTMPTILAYAMYCFIAFTISAYPLIIVFILHLEIASGLAYKVDQLNMHMSVERKFTNTLLNSTHNFIKVLEKSKRCLSNCLFFVMIALSFEVLAMLYLLPASIINYANAELDHPLLILVLEGTLFMYAFYYITLMWFFNIRSQKVADMVHQLKYDLRDVYVPSENLMVIYEDQEVTAYFMKDRIVDKLNEFKGFDGKGYFVLGKSFLTNFLAFCGTYFVILLQFKLSE